MSIELPALPAEPPDLFNPPDPAVDAHAYNRWLSVVASYKWVVSLHMQREREQAVRDAIAATGTAAADYFDAIERTAGIKPEQVFMELLRMWQIRPGDTENNIVSQIDKAARPIVAHLDALRQG